MTESNPLYPALILDALRTVRYPGKGKNIVELGMVEDDIRIDGRKVSFTLIFDKTTDPFAKSIVKSAEAAVKLAAGGDVDIEGNIAVAARTPAPAPKMFGLENEQIYMHRTDDGRSLIIPAERHGVKILSIGFLVERDSAVVWRGSMASNALKQLIEQADWGELDYFLIDMPPGTSDIHLTLVQTLGITGALVVTTPQEVALADANKGIAMFREPKINVPVLGLVENMAWFTPAPHPDERYYIFGREENVDLLAGKWDIPVLARLPLVAEIGEHSDAGSPIALENTISASMFAHLAHEVIDAVDRRNSQLPPTQKVQMK